MIIIYKYYYHTDMTSQELSNMIYDIKDKLTDKEFKDIMDKLSVKNKEEDKPELYEFTYMKMRKPTLDNDGCDFVYNFANYKIKTKDVVFEKDDQFKRELLINSHNWLHTIPFMITKSKTQNYHLLSNGCFGMGDNSVIDMYCKNPLVESESDEDDDCACDISCDKWNYSQLKKKRGATIRYRKMIGISIKKKF